MFRMFRIAICVSWLGIAAAGATELPLFFEPNQGQGPAGVEFISRGNGVSSYIGARRTQLQAGNSIIGMQLLGAARTPGEGAGKLPGLSSYFSGPATSDWHTGIPQYDRVRYRAVYPGVDLVYYGNHGKLEYDFVVAPGADVSRIRIAYDGLKNLRLDAEGNLVLTAGSGEIRQGRPVVYQEAGGKRTMIAASYRLAGTGEVRLEVAAHDSTRPLIVDPTLEYGTFVGSNAASGISAIKTDASGNLYLGGSIWNKPYTPTSPDSSGTGLVVKFSPSQNKILYWASLTPDGKTWAIGLDVDASGNAYLSGVTSSDRLPLANPFQTALGKKKYSGFVSKLAPDGQSLVYSTYMGGSDYDYIGGIVADASGNAYVTGQALSRDFPLVNALQPKASFSLSNAILAKFSPSGAVLFSTFFGGSFCEAATSIVLDKSGYPVIAGMARSSDFPGKNAIQSAVGTQSAFAAKFTPDGQSVVFATPLAGTWSSAGPMLLDGQDNLWVAGSVDPKSPLPLITPLQSQPANAFLSKLSADGSRLLYQSYFGGSVQDYIANMAVDSGGNLYLAGGTYSPNFPLKDSLIRFQKKPVSPDMPQVQGSFAFVTKLSPDGQSLIYSTLLGGSYEDRASAVAVDATGAAWVSGATFSSDFPTTPNAFQSTLGGTGSQTVFLVKLTGGALPAGPSLTISPALLSFACTTGGAQPAQQILNLGSSNGAAAAFTAAVSTSNGGNWLSTGSNSGTTPGQLAVNANSAGLAAGSYTGTIHVTAANMNPLDISVSLTVAPPSSTLVASAPNLTFMGGGQSPFIVANTSGPVSVTASVSTSNGGNWLSVTPLSGTTTPEVLMVSANAAGLAPGTYAGNIHLVASNGGTPLDIPVTLIVPARP